MCVLALLLLLVEYEKRGLNTRVMAGWTDTWLLVVGGSVQAVCWVPGSPGWVPFAQQVLAFSRSSARCSSVQWGFMQPQELLTGLQTALLLPTSCLRAASEKIWPMLCSCAIPLLSVGSVMLLQGHRAVCHHEMVSFQ